MEKENYSAPMKPLHPGLITSTDDNTMFIFEGTEKKSNWVLYDKDTHKSRQSAFTGRPGGTDHLNGLSVRLTHTITAMGVMAPIYITVYGLTDRELCPIKYPTGIHIVKIPGLCYAGNLDVRAKQIGYVVFTHNLNSITTSSVSQDNYTFYRGNLLLPFIDDIRKNQYNWIPETEIPDDLTAATWSDGASSQLNCICDNSQQILESSKKTLLTNIVHLAQQLNNHVI